MTEKNSDRLSRAEIEALRDGATPFWYGGSAQTIVSFLAGPDGMCITLTCFGEPGEPEMSTVVPWKEFGTIAADVPLMLASGEASVASGRSVHCRSVTGPGGDVR
ncbi:hypothetical protein C8D87_107104 [Lentzea atacamensis]|uniref:Uncharacterized protein n=1 Tax=Lentzea atacamensis TaxID=531938 RepID=A0ABX9E2F5_9PSEU|nr:hypothetical protein [Lentzea atacamensis]RAS62956.1 hypothetical protein C8D87_107104 [Lentzea atacamensis]